MIGKRTFHHEVSHELTPACRRRKWKAIPQHQPRDAHPYPTFPREGEGSTPPPMGRTQEGCGNCQPPIFKGAHEGYEAFRLSFLTSCSSWPPSKIGEGFVDVLIKPYNEGPSQSRHPRMLVSGVQSEIPLDSRSKHAGMTYFVHLRKLRRLDLHPL